MKTRAQDSQAEFLSVLIDAHEGLSSSQSSTLNARLLLELSQRVGSIDVLRDAVNEARRITLAADERRTKPFHRTSKARKYT